MDYIDELFYRYNPWWSGRVTLPGIVLRERVFSKLLKLYSLKDVVYIVGLRRVGKTTLMRQLIQYVIRQKMVSSRNILYISLDNYMFSELSLGDILNKYRALHRITSKEPLLVFLDNVNALPNYEDEVRRICELGEIKVYAALSNRAGLVAKNRTRGIRKQIIEILPLDFQEYLEFKKIELTDEDEHLKRGYFEEFLRTGGIPKFVLSGDISYLHKLVDDIICNDIAAVNGVKQLPLLKSFFLMLMESVGAGISVTRMGKILSISPDTARRYLQFFHDTLLIDLVERNGSEHENLRTPRKLYAGDLGIASLFMKEKNTMALVKNYVFQKIKSGRPRFVIEKDGKMDFVTNDQTAIDVHYYSSLSEKEQRFFGAFVAKKKFIIDSVEALEFLDDEPPSKTNPLKRVRYINVNDELYAADDKSRNLDRRSFMNVVE